MDSFRINYLSPADEFFRLNYFWWYKDAPVKWGIFTANVLGALSVLLLVLSPDTWGNYFLFTFVTFLVFFICNMGLILYPVMVVAFFAIRWGWLIPLFYSPYLFITQLYQYLRHGDWVPNSALNGVSKLIDIQFLYQQQDWKGLKETTIAILEYVPYSVLLIIVALLLFMLSRAIAADIETHEQ